MRVALANLAYPSTPDDSVRTAVGAIDHAAARGASIICFPETWLPGYRGMGHNPPEVDAAWLEGAWAVIEQSAARGSITVLVGTERWVDGARTISTLVVSRTGERLGFQDKVQLDPTEEGPYVPGSAREVFRDGGLTFGISICHEAWRYPETARWAARRGAQVIFVPHYHRAEGESHRPTIFAEPETSFHEKALLCRAAENTVFVAAANYASEGTPTTATVVNPDGTLHSYQPYGRAGIFLADIDPTQATGLLARRYRPLDP